MSKTPHIRYREVEFHQIEALFLVFISLTYQSYELEAKTQTN